MKLSPRSYCIHLISFAWPESVSSGSEATWGDSPWCTLKSIFSAWSQWDLGTRVNSYCRNLDRWSVDLSSPRKRSLPSSLSRIRIASRKLQLAINGWGAERWQQKTRKRRGASWIDSPRRLGGLNRAHRGGRVDSAGLWKLVNSKTGKNNRSLIAGFQWFESFTVELFYEFFHCWCRSRCLMGLVR